MIRIKGTLKYIDDIGMGGYVLHTSEGRQYSLHGDIPSTLIDKQIIVEGRPAMSMMMVGEAIEVVTIQEAPPSQSHQQK